MVIGEELLVLLLESLHATPIHAGEPTFRNFFVRLGFCGAEGAVITRPNPPSNPVWLMALASFPGLENPTGISYSSRVLIDHHRANSCKRPREKTLPRRSASGKFRKKPLDCARKIQVRSISRRSMHHLHKAQCHNSLTLRRSACIL